MNSHQFLCPFVHLSEFFPRPKKEPDNFTNGYCRGVYSFDEISAAEHVLEKFSFFSDVLFTYFFFICLFDGVCFENFQSILIHSFSKKKKKKKMEIDDDVCRQIKNLFLSRILCRPSLSGRSSFYTPVPVLLHALIMWKILTPLSLFLSVCIVYTCKSPVLSILVYT